MKGSLLSHKEGMGKHRCLIKKKTGLRTSHVRQLPIPAKLSQKTASYQKTKIESNGGTQVESREQGGSYGGPE